MRREVREEQDRRIRRIAKSATRQLEKAVIYRVECDRVSVRFGTSPTVMRNIEVAGDITSLQAGDEVSITWKDGRPVVLGKIGAVSESQSTSEASAAFIGVKVLSTVANSVATGVEENVVFDTVAFDTAHFFDAGSPDLVTIPVSGYYHIIANVMWTASAGARRVRLMANETTELARSGYVNTTAMACGGPTQTYEYLEAGDIVQVELYQNSGSTVSVTLVSDAPSLAIVKVG